MARRIVLLGTGTGVGKTYVGEQLVRALGSLGPTLGLKPIESGVPNDPVTPTPELSDAERLRRASTATSAPLPLHCYALEAPISPHLAAERVGVRLELDQIRAWIDLAESAAVQNLTGQSAATSQQSALPAVAIRHPTLHYVVIETAGGVFSPLGAGLTNFDLAQACGPATWVLVSPDSLGVLHDVTATLEALRARGRTPDHCVLCAARPPDRSTGTNENELRRLGIADVVTTLTRGGADLSGLIARLTESGGA